MKTFLVKSVFLRHHLMSAPAGDRRNLPRTPDNLRPGSPAWRVAGRRSRRPRRRPPASDSSSLSALRDPEFGDGHRRWNSTTDGGAAEPQGLPQVAGHVHVAVPGEKRRLDSAPWACRRAWCRRSRPAGPPPAARRPTPGRWRRARLLKGSTRLPSLLVPSGKRMRLSPVPGARPARCGGRGRAARIRALDEDRALQLGQSAHHRPGGDLGLGDEAAGDQRPDHRDVEIGGVVADEERRMLLPHLAAHLDLHADRCGSMTL